MKVETAIRSKLESSLQPDTLVIRNVSHHHAGHAGSPGTGESHWEVEIVSPVFAGLNKVQRQRKVYQILSEEMAGPIHALSLVTRAPGEA